MSARRGTAVTTEAAGVAGSAGTPGPDGSGEVADAVSRWLAPVVETTRRDGPATGYVMLHHFGYVRLVACEIGVPLCLTRDRRSLARDAGDAVAVLVPLDGTVRLAQDGRGACVESGQLALVDLRRAFSVEQPGRSRVLFFRLPVHALRVPAVSLRSVTARVLVPAGGVAALLAPFLLRLDASAARMPAAVGERMGGIVTEMVAALVDELTEDADTPAQTARHRLVDEVRRYIDRHLGDPALSAERIAEAHLVSVRYLHRLFEAEGITVGRLIQRRRVERCARELSRRGRVSPSLSVVAVRWGFRSAAHFSRAFKAAYGHAPRQWRRRTVTEAEERETAGAETAGAEVAGDEGAGAAFVEDV
ncbi:helix-turn-helix domain-containing protein [Streptomyces rimosus]|uniref:helix-turn-helix domain-containing protein n=1 Tax=Streptomyces rimosus TaxID=1927 RepID=UPI00131D8284|nr:helix-turn-helix domain-containing protein [Streptomyces rimosus]